MRYKLINQLVEEGKEGSTKLKDNVLKEQCKLMVLLVAGAPGEFPVQTSCSSLCAGTWERGRERLKERDCKAEEKGLLMGTERKRDTSFCSANS